MSCVIFSQVTQHYIALNQNIPPTPACGRTRAGQLRAGTKPNPRDGRVRNNTASALRNQAHLLSKITTERTVYPTPLRSVSHLPSRMLRYSCHRAKTSGGQRKAECVGSTSCLQWISSELKAFHYSTCIPQQVDRNHHSPFYIYPETERQ